MTLKSVELAECAREWLKSAKPGNAESAAAIRKVREALERYDARTRGAA